LLRRNCIGSERGTHGQTDIYYIPPSGWIAGGITICAVSNFINTGNNFGGGVISIKLPEFLMFSFCKHCFFQKFFCKEGAHCTSCYVAVGFFLVLQNRTTGFEIKSL
jgi:hypothetical protein